MKTKHNKVPGKAILAHMRSWIFKLFWGSMPPDPPSRPKNFSRRFAAIKIFKVTIRTSQFWAGSAHGWRLKMGLFKSPGKSSKTGSHHQTTLTETPQKLYTSSRRTVHSDSICHLCQENLKIAGKSGSFKHRRK